MVKKVGVRKFLSFLFNLKNVKYYWSSVLVVLVPIIMAIFPSVVKIIQIHWAIAIIFILLLVGCVVHSLKVPMKLSEQTEKINRLNYKFSNLQSFVETTPERVIKSIYQYLQFSYSERISVYRYADSHFYRIGRYSKNAEFKKGGRDKYPYSEGFIANAWNQGEFVIEDLPDPEKQAKSYIREVKSKCNIEEETIQKMKMKSRSYYCFNLENSNHDPIAVIVFESTNSILPRNTKEIRELIKSSFGHLIVDMININTPPGKGDE